VAASPDREDLVKVLLLVHGLDVGGAETMVAQLARRLRDGGDTVEVDCLGWLGTIGTIGVELRAEGFAVVVHARRPGFDATLPWRLARRIRAGRFDVVHAHQRTALFYGLLAGMLSTAAFVYSEHGPVFGAAVPRRQWLFNRALGWRVRCLSAVSAALARELSELEGFVGRSIAVVPNGVDVERTTAAAASGRDAARARIG
jgi:glycosyltransferase involved in cell wall biosynthesis